MSNRGSFKLDDLIGQSFGLLSVVSRATNNEFGLVQWNLQCACGDVVTRRANTLRSGKFYTCGKPACRFFEKVDMNGPLMPGMETNCQLWTGATKDTGYGVMKWPGEKRNVLVHVFAYDMTHDDRDGRWVLHHCDNRPCVRGDHLFAGTHRDNMRDMAAKGRAAKIKTRMSDEQRAALLSDAHSGKFKWVELSLKYGVTTRTISRLVNER